MTGETGEVTRAGLCRNRWVRWGESWVMLDEMAGETSEVTAKPLGYACSMSVWPGPETS